MFTGLIEEIGIIKSVAAFGSGRRLSIECSKIIDDLKIDDSVSISGVCQTVVKINGKVFEVEAIRETLDKTKLGNLKAGTKVNLERAMRLGDRFGGHIVQGHTDTTSKINGIHDAGSGIDVWISLPPSFRKYVVPVGSVCIDGVSLTVARVDSTAFMVSIIPHTWKVTTLSGLRSGDLVNIEFDILGKYIESLFPGQQNRSSILEGLTDQPY